MAPAFTLLRFFSVLIRIAIMARFFVLLSAVLVCSGCLPHPTLAPVSYTNGAVIESISSSASLSYSSRKGSASGSGYLMYRRPDQVRMVVLSPFGSVLQEIYVSGEQVIIIDAGNGIAFSGNYRELSEYGDLSAWRHIHWLIDIDPPDKALNSSTLERMNRFGEHEQAVFENGLLVSKTTAAAGHVHYSDYTAVDGVAFPLKITYESVKLEKFTMILDEPEINTVFAEGTFTPNLGKYRVYPLSSLQ